MRPAGLLVLLTALPVLLLSSSTDTRGANFAVVSENIRVAYILVNFRDNSDAPPSYAPQLTNDLIGRADRFFQEISYGQMQSSGRVFGWFTLPISSTCDGGAIDRAFRQSGQGGDLSGYNRRVYVLPQSACGVFGVSGSAGVFISPPGFDAIVHELMHTLGLGHANSWDCDGTVFDPDGRCVHVEYGDPYDVMGSLNSFHPNAALKHALGWLTPQTVTGSGTFRINPIERADSAVKAVRILPADVYVEYRRPVGADAADRWGERPDFNGVLLHLGGPQASSTYVLNVDPQSAPDFHNERFIGPLLRPNQVYVHPRTGTRISLAALTDAAAELRVENPGTAPAPAVTLNARLTANGVELSAEGTEIAKVEFLYRDQTDYKIGESVEAPYRSLWRSYPAGSLELLARATSAQGRTTLSAPVRVQAGQAAVLPEPPAFPDPGPVESDGVFRIAARHSSKCLTMTENIVVQATCSDNESQAFVLVDSGAANYRIISALNGRCLDIDSASLQNGARLLHWFCHNNDNQRFRLVAASGAFQLISELSGKCLEVNGGSTADQATIVQQNCTGAPPQLYTFTRRSAGALQLLTSVLPEGYKERPYLAALSAKGGTPPYRWSLASGTLPVGISLDPRGALLGWPRLVNSFFTDVTLRFRVTDAVGVSAERSVTARFRREDPAAPSITSGGVSGAAAPLFLPGTVSPGEFVSMFGTNIASRLSVADRIPFPDVLDQLRAFIGGKPMPLYFVSPGQLNAIVPYDLVSGVWYRVVLTRGSRQSVPEFVRLAEVKPVVFTANQTGSGQGLITNALTGVLASEGSAVHPGDAITVYCSGLGAVTPTVIAGTPAPLTHTIVLPVLTIGGKEASVLFAGLVPGFAGLYQINAVIPEEVTTGPAVALVIDMGGRQSPPVTFAIAR